MKPRYLPILLALLSLVAASMACAFGGELAVENVRTALDQDGAQPASVFSSSDTIYLVTDVSNAPQGTSLSTQWFAVSVDGADPNTLIDTATYNIQEDAFNGTIYFSLSPETGWPNGTYAVELYLNGELLETVNYSVQ